MQRGIVFALALALLVCAPLHRCARAPELSQLLAAGDESALQREERPAAPAPKQAAGEDDEGDRGTICEDKAYRRSLLKLIKEMPYIGLFDDLKGVRRFEASGMTGARGMLWVIFDNIHSLARIDEHFNFRGKDNVLLGQQGDDAQHEGLAYVESTGTFLAVVEAYDDEWHGLVPMIKELQLDKDETTYSIKRTCPFHFLLTHGDKGFEGLHYYEDPAKGQHYLLGLCEGNYCVGGERGEEPGHGRIVIGQFRDHDPHGDYDCHWEAIKTVHIPPGAAFTDYSGISFRGNMVAITSQMDAALWVGYFNFDTLEFEADPEGRFDVDGRVFHFPRDNKCQRIYCNVEGVEWLDDSRLVIASDEAKLIQPFECQDHDQAIHLFALPRW